MEEKPASLMKSSLISGLYLGILLILLGVILYVTGNSFSEWAQYVSYPLLLGGAIYGQVTFKNSLDEPISYGQAWGVSTMTIIFATMLSSVFTYLLYTIIDPTLQEQLRLFTEQKMVEKGLPEEQLDMALNMASKFQNPIIMAVMGIFGGAFIGTILSLFSSMIIGGWLTFEKAKEPGWAFLIPFYNTLVILRIIRKPWWWLLLMLFVPILNIVLFIWTYNLLSKRFGKDEGFTVGLILLSIVFIPILGFGDSEYDNRDVIASE